MTLSRIQRGENLTLAKLPAAVLRTGDRLYVSDKPDKLKEFEEVLGLAIYDSTGEARVTAEHPLAAEDQQLAEIVVTEGSPLARRTLNQAGFSYRYDLVPLALHRGRRSAQSKELDDEMMQWWTCSSCRAQRRRSLASRPQASCSSSMRLPMCRTRRKPRSR